MSLSRRDFLRTGAGAGALLVAGGWHGALAQSLGPRTVDGASRRSRLHPGGTRLVHADLHNHTLLSDGDGDPSAAFASMRGAGLDVAALTDHTTVSFGALSAAGGLGIDACAGNADCRGLAGLDERAWARTGGLADGANTDHAFTAIRGFEWSSPFLGHMNVWFSERWIDPLHTGGIGPEGLGEHLHENVPGAGPALGPLIDQVLRDNPARGPGMAAFYQWLQTDPATPGLGGGADAIAGFNHPGREQGRFGYFRYEPALAERVVSLELFNRRDDYVFAEFGDGQPSPLVECLDAGWRVGLLGVTDEHGTAWGTEQGKGRAGLWVSSLTRAAVREALLARRFFATNQPGLRLDAAINRVRMGGVLDHTDGDVEVRVDLDQGPDRRGLPIEVQVLRTGPGGIPAVPHVEEANLGDRIRFRLPLSLDDGDWVVLRVADPAAPNAEPGPDGHPCNNLGLAYSSPFWLQPAA